MRMPLLIAVVPGLALALGGCASTQQQVHVQHAVESDEAGVEGCEFLGTVSGRAKGRAKYRREIAFEEIAHAAGERGATHFVVTNAETRDDWSFFCGFLCGDTMEVVGKAYRCPSPEVTSEQGAER